MGIVGRKQTTTTTTSPLSKWWGEKPERNVHRSFTYKDVILQTKKRRFDCKEIKNSSLSHILHQQKKKERIRPITATLCKRGRKKGRGVKLFYLQVCCLPQHRSTQTDDVIKSHNRHRVVPNQSSTRGVGYGRLPCCDATKGTGTPGPGGEGGDKCQRPDLAGDGKWKIGS